MENKMPKIVRRLTQETYYRSEQMESKTTFLKCLEIKFLKNTFLLLFDGVGCCGVLLLYQS